MPRFTVFFSLFIFSQLSLATEPICFSDLKEHNKIKSDLPPIIQNPPLYYTADKYLSLGMVAIKVEFDPKNNKFIVNVDTRNKSVFDQYEKPVKEICIDGNTLTITPEGGPTITTAVKSSTEISIKDPKMPAKDLITVALTTRRSDYNGLLTKIHNANPEFNNGRPSTPASERALQ